MRAIVFNAKALKDLEDVWDHVAVHSVEAADRLVNRIEDEVVRLRDMPGMGHQRRDVTNPRLLFWTVWPYVVAYRATARTLYVVRIIHGARNFRRLF